MPLRTLDQLDVEGRRVLVRSDLNVPIDKDGRVADQTRIRAAARTINEILKRGGLPIVLSHLGRPKGKVDPALSLRQLVDPLSRALGGKRVIFSDNCIGLNSRMATNGQASGGGPAVVLLENVRFHPGEKENDPDFADALAGVGELYVNDAFSAAHRAHASIVGLAERRPAAAGRLMEAELEGLNRLLKEPEHPYMALFGGAKVGTKFGAFGALVGATDVAAFGGGMANTFLHAQGVDVGVSLYDPDMAEEARSILERARAANCDVLLPSDAVIAKEAGPGAKRRTVPVGAVPEDWMILDLGPESVARIIERIRQARTLVWNGPVGATGNGFIDGTQAIAEAIAERTREGALTSVVGGGDTVAVLGRIGLLDAFTHLSLAGGAFLEWL
ncbi:MAG: phosphoglycerate kinase, partial [bacterium]